MTFTARFLQPLAQFVDLFILVKFLILLAPGPECLVIASLFPVTLLSLLSKL